MLGEQNKQTSFLDIESWAAKPLVQPDSIYGLLAAWGDRLIKDEDFAELYGSTGRPSVSPALLAKVMLLMYHDNVSDRGAEERATYDLRWKTALQLPINEPGFDYTALCRFRARLLVNKKQKLVFERFVNLAKEAGVIKENSLQIIDSTHILGASAVKDTYSLIKTAIQKLLKITSKAGGAAGRQIQALTLTQDYSKDGKEDIDWHDPAARQQLLALLVKDSRAILDALRDIDMAKEETAAAEILKTVTEQDIQEENGEVSIRQGVAKDRIISVRDEEMRHGHKTSSGKFNGHKGQIVIDEATELITNAAVTPGNQPDGEAVADIIKTAIVKPGTLMGDTAYGTLSARKALEEHAVALTAPLPLGKQVPNKFSKYDFAIDWENRTCICPGKQVTVKVYQKDGVIKAFVFNKQVCNRCPLREQCTKHGKGKIVSIHPEEETRRQIITQIETPEFKKQYRLRAKVERKIAHLIRRGVRKSRYVGKAKTFIQLAFTAATINLKRLFSLVQADVSAFDSLQRVLLCR